MLPTVYYTQMFSDKVVETLRAIAVSRPAVAGFVNQFLSDLKFGRLLAEKADKSFFFKKLQDSHSFRANQSLNSMLNDCFALRSGEREWKRILNSLRDELSHGILGGFEFTHHGGTWNQFTIDHGYILQVLPTTLGFQASEWPVMRLQSQYSQAFVAWLPRDPKEPEIESMRILGYNTRRPANSRRLTSDFVLLIKSLFDRADVVEGKVAVEEDPDFVFGGNQKRFSMTDALTVCGKRRLSKLAYLYAKLGGCLVPQGDTDTRAFFYRDKTRAIDTHGPNAFKYLNKKINIYS